MTADKDFIKSLGLIGYTARIRRLNDSLMAMGKVVYKNLGVDIEPNWHLILLLLERENELTATEIANHLFFTHTAIIKIAKKMVGKGYLKTYKSNTDSRKQMYALSSLAKKELPGIKEILELIARAHEQYVSPGFIKELDNIESSLKQKNTIYRVNELLENEFSIADQISIKPVTIENYNFLKKLITKIYRDTYAYLWSDKGTNYLDETYSRENVEYELSNKAARYYFVCYENETVGILRLIFNLNNKNQSEDNFIKLQRIYLDKQVQGQGVGTKLFKWLAEEFPRYKIWLEVMDSQDEIIRFYEKLGFEIINKTQIESEYIVPRYKGMFVMQKDK
ncbi:GNAT family N-acetyltransferase [Puteibacter caeruleilacunae]|nr:GNAT family N-acetyltransferase [Puteibacter caeruleilacunae]